MRGHLIANLNPLSSERKSHSELEPERYGLTMWDHDREFITGGLGGRTRTTLREIMDILRDAYCRTLGIEYMHIQEPAQKEWIQKRVEGIQRTGGTIHIVVNNGIGFTTEAVDARSSVYATDVAKMVQAPIFHVNGDDPEACVRVTELAVAFRQEFKKDVVVDMICYRRHGHSEGDEPSYTQPLMYKQIKEKRSVRKLYTETLVKRGDITLEEAEKALDAYHETMEQAFAATKDAEHREAMKPSGMPAEQLEPATTTGVSRDVLEEIVTALSTAPESFTVHPKLKRQVEGRRRAYDNDAIDWALAEALSFGSLLLENIPVRLSGQDSRRGTFSQRHSVLVDYENQEIHVPLNHIRNEQAEYIVYDSLLSEYAVLGFEYGYSVSRPEVLVLWEAQFGDFVNGAQIIIDQFISSAEDKWNQKRRLVVLLPHGFEGQGPEHSSARLERFLTLCAEYNLRVTSPSTAAQYGRLVFRAGPHEQCFDSASYAQLCLALFQR